MAQDTSNSYRLIQISDTHLFASDDGQLVGMNCAEGLQDVTALISEREKGVKAVLFTGDASQDGSQESYRRLHQHLSALACPQYWIPGNHDELEQMRSAVGVQDACFTRVLEIGNWLIIMLDSTVPGRVAGRLSEDELQFLRASLAASARHHVMICLHHNPVPVAAAWLQRHALENPEQLFEVLDADDRVKVVIFGHIHQAFSENRNGVRYLGAPSTCVQFHPDHDDFMLDDVNPGYRWLQLGADGTVETGVQRVPGKRYPIDFSGTGY